MTSDDVADVVALCDRGFRVLDASQGRPERPVGHTQMQRNVRRFQHLLRTDPETSWVARDDDGAIEGVAVAARREGLWILSQLSVEPHAQGRGLGRQLLDHALESARGCWAGMIASSYDPKAMRRYGVAGFTLVPCLAFRGPVRRSALPAISGLRVGGPEDLGFAATVDRIVRGAAHGSDLEDLLDEPAATLLVADRSDGRGYALSSEASPVLVAATSSAVATDLLWEALARAGDEVLVKFVTAEQRWASEVLVRAGLTPETWGPICLRGMPMPMAYLPSGPYL